MLLRLRAVRLGRLGLTFTVGGGIFCGVLVIPALGFAVVVILSSMDPDKFIWYLQCDFLGSLLVMSGVLYFVVGSFLRDAARGLQPLCSPWLIDEGWRLKIGR